MPFLLVGRHVSIDCVCSVFDANPGGIISKPCFALSDAMYVTNQGDGNGGERRREGDQAEDRLRPPPPQDVPRYRQLLGLRERRDDEPGKQANGLLIHFTNGLFVHFTVVYFENTGWLEWFCA